MGQQFEPFDGSANVCILKGGKRDAGELAA
jgi:hypothetical protein